MKSAQWLKLFQYTSYQFYAERKNTNSYTSQGSHQLSPGIGRRIILYQVCYKYLVFYLVMQITEDRTEIFQITDEEDLSNC